MSQPPSAERSVATQILGALSFKRFGTGDAYQYSLESLQELLGTRFPFLNQLPENIQTSLGFEVKIKEIEVKPPLIYYPGNPNGYVAFDVFHFGILEKEQLATLEDLVSIVNKSGSNLRAALSPSLKLVDANVWCPKEASFPHLGTTSLARTQLGANAAACAQATGDKVFVVMVDQGINREVLQKRVPGAKFAGGWKVKRPPTHGKPSGKDHWIDPGTWPDGHGTRMAEAVLSVAPEATIVDLPLLPPRIRNVRGFLPWAAWVYWSLSWVIPAVMKKYPDWSWVICNSWSIYDLSHDFPTGSQWNYGDTPDSLMNRLVADIARNRLADIVFAAGNNGQFCPDPRSGLGQIGPGRSIYGVSALKEVLTVGAVRNDQTWLGYSAQGPSPCNFHSVKPDLVAPSQFTHPHDAARGYSGTSAACALAAGAFAAARSLPHNKSVSPAEMHARAVATAQPLVAGSGHPSRIGAGMLNVPGLLGLP